MPDAASELLAASLMLRAGEDPNRCRMASSTSTHGCQRTELGRLEEVRADALSALKREKKTGALVEIALDEGDVAGALELLPCAGRHGRPDYRQEVAEAAEKDHPQEALALYREMSGSAIGERPRGSYQKAAQHLKRARALYERLGARDDWDAHLRELRARYANLPALQDELRKARL